MEDILMELPEYCDDCETWHRSFIWCYDDGTYSECDQDGNHEPLEADDVPSDAQYMQAWLQYAQWVVDTGEDPLGNYLVKHVRKVQERWFLKISKSLAGPRLVAARRGKRLYEPQDIPEHLKSFLNLMSDNRLGDFRFWEQLVEVQPDIKPWTWWPTLLEQDQPRPNAVIARELRKAARKHLRRAS